MQILNLNELMQVSGGTDSTLLLKTEIPLNSLPIFVDYLETNASSPYSYSDIKAALYAANIDYMHLPIQYDVFYSSAD